MVNYIRKSDEKQRWLFASTIFKCGFTACLASVKLSRGWIMESKITHMFYMTQTS